MKRLYGTPTLIVALSVLTGWVFYCLLTSEEDTALKWRIPVDLLVYIRAGAYVHDGKALYTDSFVKDLPFTYPPISGTLFAQLSQLSRDWIIGVWQIGSIIALLIVVLLVLRERSIRLSLPTIIIAVLLTAGSIALEPVHGTFFFGQINILLLLLVSLDLLPRRFNFGGVGTGLAAALKLTPAFMGLVFLIQKRWWAAAISILTFIAAGVVGFLTVKDAETFWSDSIFQSSRVGVHENPGAQSLRSLLVRIWGIDGGPIWYGLALMTVAFTALAVTVAIRRGNKSAAMAFAGICACLISPFSWFHHWVWVVPLAIVVFVATNQFLGSRAHGFVTQQFAALGSILAMIVISLPFVSSHVWWSVSYRNLDEVPMFQPWGELLFTASGLIFIVVYALSGFYDGFGAGRGHGRHSRANDIRGGSSRRINRINPINAEA